VAQLARLLQPAAILVAGDERALWHLRDHLDERLAPLVQPLDGARSADGGDGALAEDVRRALNTVAAADTVALLEKFKEEQGQADRAADGLAATIEALNAAAVDTLLVHDDVDDERRAWFGTDLDVVALDRAALESYGVQAPQEARLVDVLVRAAFRSGARVRLVPKTVVTDGVGAILRFSS
jgi:peptide subunit release factor 1 (eRF1)